jgi:PII-like signaling protein
MNNVFNALEILVFIVNHGKAKEINRYGKKQGFTGATVMYGVGTFMHSSKWRNLFDLNQIEKDVIISINDKQTIEEAMPRFVEKFKLYK